MVFPNLKGYMTWFELVSSAFSGEMAVKVLDYLYEEYKHRSEKKKSAKELVNYHVDPILLTNVLTCQEDK